MSQKKKNDIEDKKLSADIKPKIDSSNYYKYYSNGDNIKGAVTIAHLNAYEIVPILLDEIEKAGFENSMDYVIYKLSPTQNILLTAYNTDPEFGFIYISDCEMLPSKSHRKRKSIYQKYDSCEYEEGNFKPGATLERTKIVKVPENIHLLQSDCYWYQYSDSSADNHKLVSKEDAIEIFKADVRSILLKIPK